MTKNRIEFQKISDLLTPETACVGIAGHVHPDGDCVGSCSALYLYLRKHYPNIRTDLYLETPRAEIAGIPGASEAVSEISEEVRYDLFITCDVSSLDRIGVAGELFAKAGRTACVDHHISNPGFADRHVICPDASSCAEVLAGLLDEEEIDGEIAEALYTGIIHDSGVFQYRNTSPATLRTAAMLMEKGVNASEIITSTFNRRTFVQTKILGYALEKAELILDGAAVLSSLTAEEMAKYGATLQDIDGVVAQLRFTAGTDVAVFLYETGENTFKVSLRSDGIHVNVSEIAGRFGGGGHNAAAGLTISDTRDRAIRKIAEALGEALKKRGAD